MLILHVWRESKLKSKSKMSYCEGTLQFVLCHFADKEIKASAPSIGLCLNSASQTSKSAAPKFLLQSAKINDQIRGFQRTIFFSKFWELFILRVNHCCLNLTVELVHTYERKGKRCFSYLVFSNTCNCNSAWNQQLFWALCAFHQIAVSGNFFPCDLQNSDIRVIKIYS